MDERAAIALLKSGDASGLEALVRSHYLAAVRAAYLITRDRALAEDCAQDAFLRAYGAIARFDPSRPFKPWLLRIVVREATNAVSRSARSSSLESASGVALEDLLPDPSPGPEEELEGAELREVVWEALGRLPARERAAVVMRYYLGMSEAEMAAELECAPGTVKWRLHEARQRLRVLLRPLTQR